MSRIHFLLLPAALLIGGCAAKSGGYPSRSPLSSQPAVSSRSGWWRGSYTSSESRSRRTRVAKARRYRPPADSPSSARPSPAPPSPGRAGSRTRHRRVRRATTRATPATPAAARVSAPKGTPATVATGARVPNIRMIIYNARLHIRVFQAREAMEVAQKIALETGGYLQSRNNRLMVFRVPVLRFHELVRKLEKVGEVSSKAVRSQDVTQRYMDIEVRLKAAMAVLGRLKALLAKAKNVEESLAIEKEMGRVIEKIERFKGTLKFLRHHASLSTVTVYFQIRRRNSPPIQSNWKNPFHWVKGLGLWRVMRF